VKREPSRLEADRDLVADVVPQESGGQVPATTLGSVTAADPSLATIRAAIDALDRQIVALIAERQAQVIQAGILKRGQAAEAVQAPARVEDVVGRVRTLALDAGASPDVVEATYRAMIGAFITLELDVHRS